MRHHLCLRHESLAIAAAWTSHVANLHCLIGRCLLEKERPLLGLELKDLSLCK